MSYYLFLDDERFPPDDGRNWVICRDGFEAAGVIGSMGFPKYISFDHDLGDSIPTGLDFVKWIVDADLNGHITIPNDFDYFVHSQNPVGAANIRGLLDGYLKSKLA